MREETIDAMTAVALEALSHGGSAACRSLVRELVARWPGQPALSISFALANAAAQVEDNFAAQGEQVGYRLSALVAADVFALQAMGHTCPSAQDLLHFWRRAEPFFLEL